MVVAGGMNQIPHGPQMTCSHKPWLTASILPPESDCCNAVLGSSKWWNTWWKLFTWASSEKKMLFQSSAAKSLYLLQKIKRVFFWLNRGCLAGREECSLKSTMIRIVQRLKLKSFGSSHWIFQLIDAIEQIQREIDKVYFRNFMLTMQNILEYSDCWPRLYFFPETQPSFGQNSRNTKRLR